MPSISARELRSHFSSHATTARNTQTLENRSGTCLCGRLVAEHFDQANRKRTCEELASAVRQRQAAPTSDLLALLGNVQIESLTITPDAMPGHYIARAVILDLQPMQMVAAIAATMDRIAEQHQYAVRTGWRACSDGLTIYFAASRPHSAASAQNVEAA
jgi:hypothetical protein